MVQKSSKSEQYSPQKSTPFVPKRVGFVDSCDILALKIAWHIYSGCSNENRIFDLLNRVVIISVGDHELNIYQNPTDALELLMTLE